MKARVPLPPFSEAVRRGREQSGLTQGELAKRLRARGTKAGEAHIGHAEGGRRVPSIGTSAMLIDELGIEPADRYLLDVITHHHPEAGGVVARIFRMETSTVPSKNRSGKTKRDASADRLPKTRGRKSR